MIIPIPSGTKRFRLKAVVSAALSGPRRLNEPFLLSLKGHDPSNANTYYFRRVVPFMPENQSEDGRVRREIHIPMPVSPDLLIVELTGKKDRDDSGFTLEDIQMQPLEPAVIWGEAELHRFIRFAEDFCQKAGYLDPGFYDSPDHEFLIQYLPIIEDQLGNQLVTPARIRQTTGRIQASRMHMSRYTIPVRLFILLHEWFHFHLSTRKEAPADREAARIYLDLGYPKLEAVYALTKIFQAHPDSIGPKHAARVRDMMSYIDQYSQAKQIQKQAG